MAASVCSLGPPSVGPGNSAPTIGFAVSARPCSRHPNKEPLSGNTLCHKINVERKQAIHEKRLATVKPSLSLSTPRRMEFMDKRLSKNFHTRRHHEQVVHENLKLLRALEEIHSRSNTNAAAGALSSARGGGDDNATFLIGNNGRGGVITAPAGLKRRKGQQPGSAVNSRQSSSRKKLSSLLARQRNVKAALVARENQKMIERMTRSKSLYSRETMRQHRIRHKRVLRLRKTDYTAGHLLAAATAKRHWGGGNACDEGFSYSFEGEEHSRRRNPERSRAPGKHSHGSRDTSCPTGAASSCSSSAARGTSHSPPRSLNSRSIFIGGGGVKIGGQGSRSAPRLPSLLHDDDMYGGGSILESPSLEQCLLATAECDGGWDGGNGGGDGGGGGSRTHDSGNHHKDDGSRLRNPTDVGVGSRGGSLQHRKPSSRQRGGKDASSSVDSTGGMRGTEASVDSLFQSSGSVPTSGGHRGSQQHKEEGGGRDERSTGSLANDMMVRDADLDRIFNPLAFMDETQGVRVLIQATKPLEVMKHVGETWICFIRILVKDPFDGQLDIRVIHDREEVCRRLLSLEEANAICEHAQMLLGGKTVRDWPFPFAPLPPLLPGAPSNVPAGGHATVDSTSTAAEPLSESLRAAADSAAAADTGAAAVKKVGGGASPGLRPRSSVMALEQFATSDGNLSDLLSTLFNEADTEKKGFLTPEQLTSIMKTAELGLTGPELHLVIAEADDNADGNIDYYEFIPLAYNLVNAFRARRRACEQMDEANLDLDQQAIHELYDAEFDRLVRQLKAICKAQDANGTGVLPRAEFKQCISADRCFGGLTKLEAKLLLNLLPKDSHGNVIYRKIGAGLEQVRFTTLRNTMAEARASDTQKYLMSLCREEEAKCDPLGGKGQAKADGDTMAVGSKQCSGMLRARQLTKLLLSAPLLSLSRLHVTALMSQAHIVDGMVNYVDLVPIIAKTIEGMFHPRSLKMRHDIFKSRGSGGTGGGGVSGGGGGMGEGGSQPQATATVLGKSRDDVQRIFVDVLREDNQGAGIEQLKDPATFARCMASLGLNLEPDTISALWVAADLDSREGATFVDVVDFCFNCVLFMEREKEVKSLQRGKESLVARGTPGAAVVARHGAAAVGEPPAGKVDPLLSLARALVRHAKVTAPSEGKVGLEFLLDRQVSSSEDGGSTTPGDAASSSAEEARHGQQKSVDGRGGLPLVCSDAAKMTLSASAGACQGVPDSNGSGGGGGGGGGGRSSSAGGREGVTVGLDLRSEVPGATILYRDRRKLPVIGAAGQSKIVAPSTLAFASPSSSSSSSSPTTTTTAADAAAWKAAPSGGGARPAIQGGGGATMPSESKTKKKSGGRAESISSSSSSSGRRSNGSSIEVAEEAAQGETLDMVVHVFWNGAARDRAYIEAFLPENGRGGAGSCDESCGGKPLILRLSVRVPTLAIVDAQAASKFAERMVEQIAILVVENETVGLAGRKVAVGQPQRHRGYKLWLAGVGPKSVVSGIP